MLELLKGLLTLLAALLIFTLGLLAWRKQLLDKRRFEVAEEVLVVYARLAAQVRILRQRNDDDGIREWIMAKVDGEPSDFDYSYQCHMARRTWLYRIPEKKQEAFNEVYKDFAAIVALARLYLNDDIAVVLQGIQLIHHRVSLAADVLARINPDPSIDPQNQSGEPIPSWPYHPDEEPANAEAVEKEKLHFPERFDALDGADGIEEQMYRTEGFLTAACQPYRDQGPYRFLYSFVVTLVPPQVEKWWNQRRSVSKSPTD